MNRFTHHVLIALLASAFSACLASPASAAGQYGEQAPDFPPGVFSDGGHYKLSDFEGKVLVLFFYEQDCPTCRGLIPERNKVVAQFKDKPVKFIAVGAGDSIPDVMSYVRGTRLAMPSFADNMGVMEHRYGQHISLQNIYQFRIIGPDGKIVGYRMEPAEIEKAVAGVKWKYKDAGYDPKLGNVLDLLEWNQFDRAIPMLKPLTKGKQPVNESAAKLYEALKTEAKGWLDEAEKAAKAEDPVKAYDLYARVSACFAGDDLAKTADAALKTLKKTKPVTDELAARALYDQLGVAMSKAAHNRRSDVITFCQGIVKKYPEAPTGKRATDLVKDLEAEAGIATGN
jgi:peroxiredoxin